MTKLQNNTNDNWINLHHENNIRKGKLSVVLLQLGGITKVVLWQYVVIVQPARILRAPSGTRIIKNYPSGSRALRSYGHGFTKQCKKKTTTG